MNLRAISVLPAMAIFPLIAADQGQEDPAAAWRSVAVRAQTLLRQGRFAEAADSGKHALQMAKHFGPLDLRLAGTYHVLGTVYREWSHCAEARSNYLHAIAIWRKHPDPNPQFIFNSVTNFLSALCECDDYQGAQKGFRTYETELKRYATDPLDQARLLSLQGVLARGRKDYAKGEAYFRQSLDLMNRTRGASPLDIAQERTNLSVVLDKEGRVAESLAESERAIAFFEENFPNHPTLIAALNNAACALADLGRMNESERMFERTLARSMEMYGEDNHVTAKIMLSYARVLRENKQTPASANWQKRGAEAFRRALARDNGMVDLEELRQNRK